MRPGEHQRPSTGRSSTEVSSNLMDLSKQTPLRLEDGFESGAWLRAGTAQRLEGRTSDGIKLLHQSF